MKKPLQVGDRVRFYGGVPGTVHTSDDRGELGTVVKVVDGHPSIRFDKESMGGTWSVFWQQCRRVRQPREFFIGLSNTGQVLSVEPVLPGRKATGMGAEAILVREVRTVKERT